MSSGSVADVLATAADLPRHEAERLLRVVTGRTRIEMLLGGSVEAASVDRFDALVRRRRAGEPLQYLEGTVQFGPVELAIDPRALIPRPETEQLWDLVVRSVRRPPAVVVDLCTGSGNLALACKHAWPAARVIATELSPDAAELACENVERTGLDVEVLVGDLFDPLPPDLAGRVDVLVANPPYLAESELTGLDPQVRDHEPHFALIAGSEGDEILSRIAAGAPRWVRPGGLVACEISEFHPDRLAELFAPLGGVVLEDSADRPRFVIASFKGTSQPARGER